MFCTKCGAQIDDSANFCVKCGSEISGLANIPKEDARTVVKNTAKSGLFLAAAILFTVGILITTVTNIGMFATFDSLVANYYELFGGVGDVDLQMYSSIYSGIAIGGVIGTLIGSIPNIIMIIGIWMIFGGAAKKESPYPSTTGFALCKGVNIATMVMVIVAFSIIILASLILLIAGIVMAINAVEIEASIVLMIIGGLYCVIFSLALVFYIIYYAKVIKTIKAVTTTVKTGTPTAYVSRLVIFMCFFTGISNAITSLTMLSIGGMAIAAAFIIFGVILVKYRKQMTYLRDNGNFTAEVINIQ